MQNLGSGRFSRINAVNWAFTTRDGEDILEMRKNVHFSCYEDSLTNELNILRVSTVTTSRTQPSASCELGSARTSA